MEKSKNTLHPYLIHTHGLSKEETLELLAFLQRIAWIGPNIVAKTIETHPDYIIHCYTPADEFAALPFPVSFQWEDLSGQDLAGRFG